MSVENSSARDEIIASIRRNLRASAPHDHERSNRSHRSETVSAETASEPTALTERFVQNLEAVQGQWAIVSDASEAVQVLQQIFDEHRPRRIAVSDAPFVRALMDKVKSDTAVVERASASELFDCDLGITTAQLAMAETGTLVLRSESEFSRLTSLVPEMHVCILEANRIRNTMSEVLAEIQPDLDPAVTFITGPSRTSDIELTLAIGVHGPRELFVIVIENSAADQTSAA